MNIVFTKHAAERFYERLQKKVNHNTLYANSNYVKTNITIQHNKSDRMCDVYIYIGQTLKQHALLINDKSEYFKKVDKRDYRVCVTVLLLYNTQDNHFSNQVVRDAYAAYKQQMKK